MESSWGEDVMMMEVEMDEGGGRDHRQQPWRMVGEAPAFSTTATTMPSCCSTAISPSPPPQPPHPPHSTHPTHNCSTMGGMGSAPASRAAMVVVGGGTCSSGGKLSREGGAAGGYEEPDAAARGGGGAGGTAGGKKAAAGLRRSFSHSNLHDRSTSLDRPSVIQCIKAIGFIFEHMAKEDSYRERSRGFDFSSASPGGGGRGVGGNGMMDWEDGDDQMMMMGGESQVSGEEVSAFLDSLYLLCKWTPECNIMALILIVRLFQYNPDLTLHESNWKRLLLTALMIAQKTWDDRALMNKDFPAIWAAVAGNEEQGMNLEEVNELEREFFRRLDHHLFIAPAMYASTYFELCSLVPSEEAIKNQLHQLIQVAGTNVRVVQSQKVDNSYYNTAEVIYSPNAPAHVVGGGGMPGGGMRSNNGTASTATTTESQAPSDQGGGGGGAMRKLHGWFS